MLQFVIKVFVVSKLKVGIYLFFIRSHHSCCAVLAFILVVSPTVLLCIASALFPFSGIVCVIWLQALYTNVMIFPR